MSNFCDCDEKSKNPRLKIDISIKTEGKLNLIDGIIMNSPRFSQGLHDLTDAYVNAVVAYAKKHTGVDFDYKLPSREDSSNV